MERDKILEKSRKEHQGQDLYEQEVAAEGRNIGMVVALLLATVFFVIQICVGGGRNYGLYAILGAVLSVQAIAKAARLRRRREMVLAAIYTGLTVACGAIHIYQLVVMPVNL